jgi:hypothetical protein
MKRFLLLLSGLLTMAGAVSAQAPGGQAFPPAYYGPGAMTGPGAMGGPPSMPAYYGPGSAPGPGMMGGPGPMPMSPEMEAQKNAYGWHPGLRSLFTKSKSCDSCNGKKKTGYFNKSKVVTSPETAQGGTLVFPNHQFVRSPRDFFMQD